MSNKYFAIMDTIDDRVSLYSEFDNFNDAETHVENHSSQYPNAFIVNLDVSDDITNYKVQGEDLVYDPISPLPVVPQVISRRQFYQGLATAEFITKPEAINAIKGALLPTAIQSIVDSLPDEDAKFSAEMLLLGAGEFHRDHPLVAVFAASQDLTETEVDDFWRMCAGL